MSRRLRRVAFWIPQSAIAYLTISHMRSDGYRQHLNILLSNSVYKSHRVRVSLSGQGRGGCDVRKVVGNATLRSCALRRCRTAATTCQVGRVPACEVLGLTNTTKGAQPADFFHHLPLLVPDNMRHSSRRPHTRT
jgi:RNase P protein component